MIYNPRAGKIIRSGGLVERAHKALVHRGHRVTMAPTTGPNTAGEIARLHAERGADLIVVAGGDGTINEAAEGIVGSAVPMAILPCGTANVLAVEAGIGLDPARAARHLDELKPRRISVGHVVCDEGRVSRHFLLMAGVGLDAQIVYNVNAALKARTGKLAYWLAGWSLLGKRLVQLEVEIGGGRQRCSFVLMSRVRNYGGDFEIAKTVRLIDDTFEAVMFEGDTTVPYVKYFAAMAMNRLKRMRGVEILRVKHARISGEEKAYVQIDGEYAGRLPAEVNIVPDALTLLLPEDYGK
ncbi:MAG TPA: diacylglycerol kinase family protein [Candidatus Solibacter sp.]|nr:diacylglycerol kinase family protein [Candidatus Solibacter sp.]